MIWNCIKTESQTATNIRGKKRLTEDIYFKQKDFIIFSQHKNILTLTITYMRIYPWEGDLKGRQKACTVNTLWLPLSMSYLT
jgi:hypothetical protein